MLYSGFIRRPRFGRIGLCALAALALGACGGDDDGDDPGAISSGIEIAGDWKSDFGEETIADNVWGTTPIIRFDNDGNWAITRNADDAEYFPGTFSKIVWTDIIDGGFFYCTVDFGLDSADAAASTAKSADATDPATGGCGDFSWTSLTPK